MASGDASNVGAGNTGNEGETSNNNNQLIDSAFARMAEFFVDQRNQWIDRGGRVEGGAEVTHDKALERFQKFNPPKYNGEPGVEIAEK